MDVSRGDGRGLDWGIEEKGVRLTDSKFDSSNGSGLTENVQTERLAF